MPRTSDYAAAGRLRRSYIAAIVTSCSILFTCTLMIANVGPLLPQPERDANFRLGVILALACSATLSSALLVVTEIVVYRNHTQNFACVPHAEAHLIRTESDSSANVATSSSATTGSNSSRGRQQQQQRGNAAAPSVARSRSSDTIQPTPSNTGSEPLNVKSGGGVPAAAAAEKGRDVEKSSDVATQTERPGTV